MSCAKTTHTHYSFARIPSERAALVRDTPFTHSTHFAKLYFWGSFAKIEYRGSGEMWGGWASLIAHLLLGAVLDQSLLLDDLARPLSVRVDLGEQVALGKATLRVRCGWECQRGLWMCLVSCVSRVRAKVDGHTVGHALPCRGTCPFGIGAAGCACR